MFLQLYTPPRTFAPKCFHNYTPTRAIAPKCSQNYTPARTIAPKCSDVFPRWEAAGGDNGAVVAVLLFPGVTLALCVNHLLQTRPFYTLSWDQVQWLSLVAAQWKLQQQHSKEECYM